MTRASKFLASFVAVAAALMLAGGVYLQRSAARETVIAVPLDRPAQAVQITEVVLIPMRPDTTYTGTVRPRHMADLGFRLAGKLAQRLVDVGDRVSAGQPIASLDDTDLRLDLDAARAERTAATTDLARAAADVGRVRLLFAQGHVAQASLDRAISDAAEARARADRAERMHDLAANRLTYATLVADNAGIVTAAPAEAGQVVAAGQLIIRIARTDALEVEFALPEHKRDTLDNATATARLWGADDAAMPLALREVSPDVDPVARTYRIRMTLGATGPDIDLGRTVTVTLAAPDQTEVAVLPLSAVVNDGHGPRVWRLRPDGHSVEPVDVVIAALDDRSAMIRGGLAAGDRIISLGAHKINPARPVRVVETAAAPES